MTVVCRVFLLKICCVSLLGCALFFTHEPPPLQPLPMHQRLPSFSLLNYQGQAISLESFYLQKAPVLFFLRNFKQDEEYLQALKTKIKEFYLEGCVVFAIYPENAISFEEIEALKLPVHFLIDSENKIAKKYHVFDASTNAPHFAIFTGDFAFRCQFQQAVADSRKALSPSQLLQGITLQQKKAIPNSAETR